MNKPLCIYHANCADGFAAATVVRMAYGADNIDFHPARYQNPPPDVSGRDVILVDFSYKRPVLLEMASLANHILILDHHKSAKDDLVDLPSNVELVFDMNRSGAVMAFNHYYPRKIPYQLLLHIQDRDLWRFELQGTKEIQAALFSYPYDFDLWESFMKIDGFCVELFKEGTVLVRKHTKDVNELIKLAATRDIIGGYDVPVLNAPYFYSSEAGHIMCEGEKFAACYYDLPDRREYSLRSSTNGGIDVSKVAIQYGGGGHKHAAGFSIPLKKG